MKVELYAIYDEAIQQYGFPISFRTQQEACREIVEVLYHKDNMLAKYPDQFKLYKLGTMNTETGWIECLPRAEFVIGLRELSQVVYGIEEGEEDE